MSSFPINSEIRTNRNLCSDASEIDNEKLINEIHSRPRLWNQVFHEYGFQQHKMEDWDAVASEMNMSVAEVKNRWKLLKDSFNRELKNTTRGDHNATKWIYYDQMSFLLEGTNRLLLPRVTEKESDSGYLSPSMYQVGGYANQNTASNGTENEFSESTVEGTETPLLKRKHGDVCSTLTNSTFLPRATEHVSNNRYLSSSLYQVGSGNQNIAFNTTENEFSESSFITAEDIETTSPKKKQRKICDTLTTSTPISSICADSVNDKKDAVQAICPDSGSEDYLFLMSLMPSLERLPDKKKMWFKMKMMQKLFEASYENDD